jgi:hypothetical protein
MADTAMETLLRGGFREDEITMVMAPTVSTEEHDLAVSNQANSNAEKGIVAGGVAGGAFGGFVAAAIAAGAALTIPGVGLFIAGPFVAGLAGAVVGGATGSLLGSLVGLGIPEDRATYYESGLRRGGIVLGIQAKDEEEAEDLENKFIQLGAEGVEVEKAASL